MDCNARRLVFVHISCPFTFDQVTWLFALLESICIRTRANMSSTNTERPPLPPLPKPNALLEVIDLPNMTFEKNVDIPLKDGLGLCRGNVYRPKGEGKWPVLLTCESGCGFLRLGVSLHGDEADHALFIRLHDAFNTPLQTVPTVKTSPMPRSTASPLRKFPIPRNRTSQPGKPLTRITGSNRVMSS